MVYNYYKKFKNGGIEFLTKFLKVMMPHWESIIREILETTDRSLKSFIEIEDIQQELCLLTVRFFNSDEYLSYSKSQISNRYSRLCKKCIQSCFNTETVLPLVY